MGTAAAAGAVSLADTDGEGEGEGVWVPKPGMPGVVETLGEGDGVPVLRVLSGVAVTVAVGDSEASGVWAAVCDDEGEPVAVLEAVLLGVAGPDAAAVLEGDAVML